MSKKKVKRKTKEKEKTKNKKYKLNIVLPITIIISLLFVMIVSLSIAIIADNRPFNKVKYVDDIVQDVFFNKNVSIEKLENTLQQPMINEVTFIGKDSALRYRPDISVIKAYGLQRYIEEQNKYSEKVENLALENIEYEVDKVNDKSIDYKIKPWYIYKYSYDLTILKELIMEDAGFEITDKNAFKEEYEVNEFKARVVALKILDKHLEDYDNNDEILDLRFIFNGKRAAENELLSLYYNLEGVTSKNSPNKMTEQERDKETKKMKKYLEESQSNGLYNKKNPYNI